MGKTTGKLLAVSFLTILFMSLAGPSLRVFADETSGAEYQVQKGDCLYGIARTQLGSGARWAEIFELNREVIKDPSLIYIGQVIKLPGAEAQEAAAAEAQAQEAAAAEQQEADQYARQLCDAAAQKEPEVTAVLKSLENDKAHLVGLENRLKTLESTSRKILLNAHDMEISVAEASKTVSDVLRYTFVIEDSVYVATTKQITDTLIAGGYAVSKFKNYWVKDDVAYQGINALFVKDGVIFELQFHTPISYYTKGEKTHAYYEIIRSETASEQEKAEARKKHDAAFAEIPVPAGVETLKY